MRIRHACYADLPAIVAIYNASIPGRQATADTEPVTVAAREAWFHDHNPARRPLLVAEDAQGLAGWLSVRSFYGRPAYAATVKPDTDSSSSPSRPKRSRRLAKYFT